MGRGPGGEGTRWGGDQVGRGPGGNQGQGRERIGYQADMGLATKWTGDQGAGPVENGNILLTDARHRH